MGHTMSRLYLRLEVPCPAEQLSLVALFAAEHDADTWSSTPAGHLVTSIDLDKLTVDTAPPTVTVTVDGDIDPAVLAENVRDHLTGGLVPKDATQEAGVDGPELEADAPTRGDGAYSHDVVEPGSEPTSATEGEDRGTRVPVLPALDDNPLVRKRYRTGSTRHRILTLVEARGGRWEGGPAALARAVSPDAPASAAAEITKMVKADLLVRHGGHRVTALTLPGVEDEHVPPSIEPRFDRRPIDVDKARERAAAAL
jgi:hypothetical protein